MPELSNPTLRYPAVDDKVDVPGDMLELATDVHAAITADRARLSSLEAGGAWQALTVDSRFAAVAGYTPVGRRVGSVVYIVGMLTWQTGHLDGSPMVTLPSAFQPARNTPLGLRRMVSTDCLLEPFVIGASITLPSASYRQGTPVVGRAFSISCTYSIG